ncbi:MAG: NAD-dependent epimerase/dehydratase family protein, partial [Anaerolineae bacterium]
MNILVTGSQGGIGSRLVQKLLDGGHSICTVDQKAAPKGTAWEHHPGDIRDLALMRMVMQDIDFVFHLAADLTDNGENQERTYTVNVQGTWNVLMACVEAGVRHLVYFSSVQALGHSNPKHTAIRFPIDDDVPSQPATPYQISKHAAEETCRGFTVNND